MSRWLQFLAVVAVLAAGCIPGPNPPNPPPVEVTDGGTADPPACAKTPAECACDKLVALGCAEGGQQCVATVEHILESRLTAFDPECVAAAQSKTSVRACPAIKCP